MTSVALSQKKVSEWSENLRATWVGSPQDRRESGPRGGPRDRTGRTRTLLTGDFQAILDDAARVNGTLASRTMLRPSTGTCHRPLYLCGSRVSRNVVRISRLYRYTQRRYFESGPIWNEVLAELRCFWGLLLVLSSSWWLPWNPCVLQSDASLQGWALAHSFWSRGTVAEVAGTLERSSFRRTGRHWYRLCWM